MNGRRLPPVPTAASSPTSPRFAAASPAATLRSAVPSPTTLSPGKVHLPSRSASPYSYSPLRRSLLFIPHQTPQLARLPSARNSESPDSPRSQFSEDGSPTLHGCSPPLDTPPLERKSATPAFDTPSVATPPTSLPAAVPLAKLPSHRPAAPAVPLYYNHHFPIVRVTPASPHNVGLGLRVPQVRVPHYPHPYFDAPGTTPTAQTQPQPKRERKRKQDRERDQERRQEKKQDREMRRIARALRPMCGAGPLDPRLQAIWERHSPVGAPGDQAALQRALGGWIDAVAEAGVEGSPKSQGSPSMLPYLR